MIAGAFKGLYDLLFWPGSMCNSFFASFIRSLVLLGVAVAYAWPRIAQYWPRIAELWPRIADMLHKQQ